MERRIEGALPYPEDIAGHLPNAIAYSPTMHRFQRQRLEDQHVERSLHDIGDVVHSFFLSEQKGSIRHF
jgi:hypothetical protein